MKEGTVFQPRELQFNLDNINRLPTQQMARQKKIFNVPVRESNPRPVQGRRPNHKATGSHGYTTVQLMYLWIKLGGHWDHYKDHNTLDTDT